jgi:hypothetical protein
VLDAGALQLLCVQRSFRFFFGFHKRLSKSRAFLFIQVGSRSEM